MMHVNVTVQLPWNMVVLNPQLDRTCVCLT
uniref:Uncharacterized protein n=1 Tax=Arundo donax TaxID=35708 RepID=A0A0A9G058_ARUDO